MKLITHVSRNYTKYVQATLLKITLKKHVFIYIYTKSIYNVVICPLVLNFERNFEKLNFNNKRNKIVSKSYKASEKI